MTRRVFTVDILSAIFGIGSWICIIGVFVELPLLVQTLPEAWTLPSILSVVIQIANVGPILFSLCIHFFPNTVTDKRSIYASLCLGVGSTLLLSFYWKWTTFVFGANHSTGLILLTFILGMVDCSSRVMYPPFMNKFKPAYLVSYFVGEGLSGLIPALLALLQGVGEAPTCVATYHNDSQNATYAFHSEPPLFSIDIFFLCLLGMFVFSALAFHLLHYDCIVKQALAIREKFGEVVSNLHVNYGFEGSTMHAPSDFRLDVFPNTNNVEELKHSENSGEVMFLLGLQCLACFVIFGFLPSVQSFACLPYSASTYHMAVSLSFVANPVVCLVLLTPILPKPTRGMVIGTTVIGLLLSCYAGIAALMSPEPPLVGTVYGQILVVGTWILLTSCFTYTRVSIYAILQELRGKRGMFWCGIATQVGVAVGSFGTFFLVNFTTLFKSYVASCP